MRHIFQFITEHQEHQTLNKSDHNKDLLQAFHVTTSVSYDDGSIVFPIEPEQVHHWVQCLDKKVREPVPLNNDSGGLIMKIKELKIPLVSCHNNTNYGSLAVTIWPNPANGQPKACVQGKMYLAFVSFVLPGVLKDMRSHSNLALGIISFIGFYPFATLTSVLHLKYRHQSN